MRRIVFFTLAFLILGLTSSVNAQSGYVYTGHGQYSGDSRPPSDQKLKKGEKIPAVNRPVPVAGQTSGPKTELAEFVYLDVNFVYGRIDDIQALNRWLRVNPDKQVLSFTSVRQKGGGLKGYIMKFTKGDNSQQFFERIFSSAITQTDQPQAVEGLAFLQDWVETHQFHTLVAFTSIPSAENEGCGGFTVLYKSTGNVKAKPLTVQAESTTFELLK